MTMSNQYGKSIGQRVVRQAGSSGESLLRWPRSILTREVWLRAALALGWALAGLPPAWAIPPALECSTNLTAECRGTNGVAVTFTTGAGSHASRCIPPSGSIFRPGATVVRCTTWNSYGETNTCKFVVTVVDTSQPSLECPATVVVPTNPGRCSAAGVVLGFPTARYFVGPASLTNNAPGEFPKGTNLVTWFAADAASNRVTCLQQVIVLDRQPPLMALRAEVRMPLPDGRGFVSNSGLEPPVVTDNCGGTILANDAPVELAPGTNRVRWTATDSDGNSVSGEQQVIVMDTQAPSLECPPDVLVAAEGEQAFAANVELSAPLVSDNHLLAEVTNDVHALYGAGRDWWWVDPVGGDDARAVRGDYRRPFRTLGAALAAAQDGDTILMRPGTNFIRCAFFVEDVPELMVTRSNLSILGQPGATLVATNLGDGIRCLGAANLKIKGLTLHGFRTNYAAAPFRLWAAIHIQGGCEGSEIAGNRLDNWMNQGIAVLNGDPSTSTNVWVHDNFVTRCGFVWRTTNGFPLNRFDGAAIVPDAGWLVESNRIEDCAYTIEVYPPESLGFRAPPCVVRNNVLKNNLIGIYGGNNLCPAVITGNTVVNATNYLWAVDTNFSPWIGDGSLGGWLPYGVVLQGNLDGPVVSSNTIAGWRVGILALHGVISNAVLAGNCLSEFSQAGILVDSIPSPTALSRNLAITGNIFTNAGSCWSGYGAITVYGAADLEIAGNSISGEFTEGVSVYGSSLASSNVVVRNTRLDGDFDWGVRIGDGTRDAKVSNTAAEFATFQSGKYYTSLPAVIVIEGQPVTPPPWLPARADLDEPWILASGEAGLGSDVPPRFPLGTNIVLWIATDTSGNAATCAQRVIVHTADVAPSLSPEDLVVTAQSNCTAVVSYPLPELVTGSSTRAVVACQPAPGTVFPLGSTTVRCSTTDGSGNSIRCAFQITVTDAPPVLSLRHESGQDDLILSWPQTCVDWVLEASSSCVGATDWSPVEAAATVGNGVRRVILPVESDQQFFRLRRP